MANNPLGIALHDAIGPLDPAFTASVDMPEPSGPKPISKGQLIAGILADALAGAAGQPGQFAAMMRQRQQQEQEEAQWTRRQQSQLQGQMALEQWRRDNPAPTAPHYFETNNGSIGMIGPDGKPQIVYDDPTPKMNFIPDGLGGGQWVAVPGQAPTMPMQPVGGLAPVGKLTPMDGGPTATPSGGFPRSY